MKKQTLAWLLVSSLFLLGGCQENEKLPETTTKTSTTSQVIETTTQTTEISQENKISKIEEYLNELKNEPVGIYIERPDSKEQYGVNQEKNFYGASIAKLPIIFYTQEKLKKEEISLETTFPYIDQVNEVPGAMVRGGTGVMQQMELENQTFSVAQLLEWSIRHSDNLASNMLGYYVAEQNGNEFLETIAPFYATKQTEFSKEMTAKTAGEMMLAIYRNELGKEYFLETDWQKEKIGSLDKDVYHKIGTNDTFNHDVGIVDGKKPYVLSILSDGYSNEKIEKIVKNIDELMDEE
ncbi:class A beta-lactamase-related serine hydrolase [Vagococcus carniphilus]|uniref:Class A beta-lactamase-related serine hydrolase n=1 Tax=Vagococcus carniphilus TaxID=218144 RepID=A0AAW8U0E6_9ENTE|nr:serine hydrolase [Vagococcus carniphilus]MDT2833015.1 class A beta-lactamase-related serine hydrolase [Vagococcus carniphilus]MDT2849586.1 class A beta-lactamase-related serine hydrolase [Vagococcus carniphilus]